MIVHFHVFGGQEETALNMMAQSLAKTPVLMFLASVTPFLQGAELMVGTF